MIERYGLGALPSPSDPRDYPLQLAPLTAPLSRRFVCDGMPNVLNQGSTPQCEAFASSGMKSWQEKRDKHGLVDFDEGWLYSRCKSLDGIPGAGTDGRSAMRVLKGSGLKALNRPEPPEHFKIAAYYAVPLNFDGLRTAIMQYGPVVLGGRWYSSWFRPTQGLLPAPAGGVAGGHAVLAFGWDLDVGGTGGSLLIRNSWGEYAGSVNGNFYAPVRFYLPALWEAWRAEDVITGAPGPR